MISRRSYLKVSAAGSALALLPGLLRAATTGEGRLLTRKIPGTDEALPLVGLGSSASFARLSGEGNLDAVRDLLQKLAQHHNAVFDTAPSYGASEKVAAELARSSGVNEKLFWATKVNVAGRGGGQADRAAAKAQIEQSFSWLGKPKMDLIQVHNLGDVPTQLGILKDLRDAGRVRYIGVTTTFADQYAELERIMRAEPLNFIGVDYAIDHRVMEEKILPLAQDRGIGVLVYQPFGRSRLWQRIDGKSLPDWASEYDIASWGQFFLKFVISHPAVTAATPATSRVTNLVDNLGAATGRLPDEAGRRRMIAYLESI